MERSIILIAHNIRSLWNVGSFFRTADSFVIDHIHLCGYTPTPPRKEISKTALGAEEWLSWSKDEDVLQVLTKRKAEGYTVYSLELADGSVPLKSVVPSAKTCIVVGHEILGVPQEVLASSDVTVSIPMLGKKNSLNVSVAAGIALYHFRYDGLSSNA